jgi:adenylate kinase
MSRGELVPDSITVKVLKERIRRPDCLKGFILDGYPRTIQQAEELDKIAGTYVVILLNIPEDILVEKLSARRVCAACGEIYNIADTRRIIGNQTYELPAMLPRVPGICDKCGGKLIQRKDDTAEVIRNRLEVYNKQTEPLVRYYRDKGLIEDIHVTSGPNVMVPKIQKQLDRRAKMVQPKSESI